jgi:hypothetical protein
MESRAMTGAIFVGAVVTEILAAIMLGALVAVVVIASMDVHNGRRM